MKNKINACAEAAQLLAELRQKKYPPVPTSWFTAEQFREHEECSPQRARKDLSDMLVEGMLISQSWPMLDSMGRGYRKIIYKNKKKS